MTRYDKLMKAISGGYDLKVKSNTRFNDWSPHNIRRLIIGMDMAIIQYHVTTPKQTKLHQVVDYSLSLEEDMRIAHETANQLKSLVGVLVDGRICSAIEEIVFCIAGYDNILLNIDYDMGKLIPRDGNIENRFPRLAKVYKVNARVGQIESIVRESADDHMSLLLPKLQKAGVPCQVTQDCNKEWYYGNTKFWNSTIYALDAEGSPLYRRLQKIGDDYKANIEKMKRQETADNRDQKIVADRANLLKDMLDTCETVANIEANIIKNLGYVNKVQYGMYLMPAVKAKFFKNAVGSIEAIKKIYWLELKTLLDKYAPECTPLLFRVYYATQGKAFSLRDSTDMPDQYHKEDLFKGVDNMKAFTQLAKRYTYMMCDTPLAALLAMLSPVSLAYAGANYKAYNLSGAENIYYSETISQHLNIVMNSAEKACGGALKAIGCNLVSEDDIKHIGKRSNNALTALSMLEQYKSKR